MNVSKIKINIKTASKFLGAVSFFMPRGQFPLDSVVTSQEAGDRL